MGKRIMFMDADFSKNGLKIVTDMKWVFGLQYQNLDAANSTKLNEQGIAVFDAANCKNFESTQKHITKIRFDAAKDGVFQILKVDKDDYKNYEVIQEIECAVGNAQEIDVDIEIGSNHYLGVKNISPSGTNAALSYHHEIGDYGVGMKFIMRPNSENSVVYDFPNSVIRIDFLNETERYE